MWRIFRRRLPLYSAYFGRVNTASFDGYVVAVKNSFIGYNLQRTDHATLWSGNQNSLVP
jgi:hypothetical protein